jgi:hypothetical protein
MRVCSRYFSFLGYEPSIVDPHCQGISQTGGQTALILPTQNKKFFHPTFAGKEWEAFWNYIWAVAAEAVRLADKIVIVGYSMPQADERARELLLKRSNPGAEILVFSGGSSQDICHEFGKHGFQRVSSRGAGKFEDYLTK